MESVKFQKLTNEQGLITDLTIGGLLVVENSQHIKIELLGVLSRLDKSVKIEISEVDNIDLSFIQLIVAFRRQLYENGIKFQFNWSLDYDQRLLFENVGLINELFMND
jgi:anti-anti-sigma regulatory factor